MSDPCDPAGLLGIQLFIEYKTWTQLHVYKASISFFIEYKTSTHVHVYCALFYDFTIEQFYDFTILRLCEFYDFMTLRSYNPTI